MAFGMEASFHLGPLKEIPKIEVHPSGTLSQTLVFIKFRRGKSIMLSTKLVDGLDC